MSTRRPSKGRTRTAPSATARRSAATRRSAAASGTSTAAATRPSSAGLAVGGRVPDFTLPATGGGQARLSELAGRKLVLYFYPRDNTPGCTLEGQQFAALAPRFARAGVTVFGISRDSLASHEKFRARMGYPFALLSDGDERVCRLFDVIRKKNMYGRSVLGVERSTFLIDGAGVLRREWRRVKVEGHAQEVLEAAQAL